MAFNLVKGRTESLLCGVEKKIKRRNVSNPVGFCINKLLIARREVPPILDVRLSVGLQFRDVSSELSVDVIFVLLNFLRSFVRLGKCYFLLLCALLQSPRSSPRFC